MKKLLLLSLLILCFFAILSAERDVKMIVNDFDYEDGLPHNSVYSVLKDSEGMMWFATWYGLSSFDGVKFQSYNSRELSSQDIPPHKLQRVLEADESHLWVKTIDHKLYLFDKHNETFLDLINSIQSNFDLSPKIIKIQKSGDKLLMLNKDRYLLSATMSAAGLSIEQITPTHSSLVNTSLVNQFIELPNSLNWVGADFKLFQIEKGEKLKSKPADYIRRKLGSNSPYDFSAATLNAEFLYLGDQSGALSEVNVHTGEVSRTQVFEKNTVIKDILVAGNGKLKFIAGNDGVYALDGNKTVKILTLAVADKITSSLLDSYDQCWWVVNNKTIFKFDPVNKELLQFNLSEGRVLPDVKVIDGNELGMFFLSRAGDVYRFDRLYNRLLPVITHRERLLLGVSTSYFDILLDKDQVFWMTSTSEGISKITFPKQQFNVLKLPDSAPLSADDAVKNIFRTKNLDVWVAKRNGLVYQFDKNKKLKRTFGPNSLYDIGNVYHFMEDHRGNLWFSTKGNGLVKATPDKSTMGFRFERFIYDDSDRFSISGNDVYYTYEDSNKNIWVGLFGGGLNLIVSQNGKLKFLSKSNSFENYPKSGLYLEVRSITEDKFGRIWMATSDGLLSFKTAFTNPDIIKFDTYRDSDYRSNVSDNDIYALYKDSEADVWVSVFGGGLSKLIGFDEEKHIPLFETYTMVEGVNSHVIISIVEDDDKYLWLATENSLARFDKKSKSFRNFDRYDGFPDIRMEEESALKCLDGSLWFGSRAGVLSFNPRKLESYSCAFPTVIVDFLVSNKSVRKMKDLPITEKSIQYTERVELKYNQNNFVIEFAALNYFNLNRITYRYTLKGFEDVWHDNGKNRYASYPNIPPGEYEFIVQSIDEANPELLSERKLIVKIFPPWWKSWIAYLIYSLLAFAAAYAGFKLVMYMIKMRNEVYIEQRVSELKIRFFTNISHELRTPLTLIMGPIHELKEKYISADKGKEYIGLIEKSSNQMLQLVNQILDFRKIQNGKMTLNVSHFNLNDLIKSFATEFEILSEEKKISYSFHLSEEEVYLWGDKDRLEIVIRNIISNAFKFTDEGGSIFVTTEFDEPAGRCYVKIEDTGVGIPQNKLSEIFERFSQVGGRKTYQGSGIGLALSKEIVGLHHGEINVNSTSEKGTVFTVELFTTKEHFKEDEVNFFLGGEENENQMKVVLPDENLNSSAELTSGVKPTVLVVEDNKDLCALLRLQLEDKFTIYDASNGEEGLRLIEKLHPELVVTDLMMPVMSGMEMLKQLRNDFKISHIPVVILTAKHNEDAKIQALNLGANAYITKPFNKDFLIATIDRLLHDRKVFKEKIWTMNRQVAEGEEETYETFLVKKDLQLLEKIHQVIEENIQNSDYNIDNIAETLGLSRSAFFKKLKSMTGLAPVDLIKEIRLNKSVELMKTTDLSISEIAFDVGFKEAGYFGKCFRKRFNQTPSEFLSQIRKK